MNGVYDRKKIDLLSKITDKLVETNRLMNLRINTLEKGLNDLRATNITLMNAINKGHEVLK